jgi:transcriptional regulator with XRE-family HTH domain
MTDIPLEQLGRLIAARRGRMGVRAAAAEVGVGSATLSRVENGQMPDLQTFAKICKWLELDAADFLGLRFGSDTDPAAMVHFRKQRTVSAETASSLAELILSTQRAARARERLASR